MSDSLYGSCEERPLKCWNAVPTVRMYLTVKISTHILLLVELTFPPQVFSHQSSNVDVTHGRLRVTSPNIKVPQGHASHSRTWTPNTSDRSLFLLWIRAMLSSQVLRSSGVLVYDLARLYWRSTSISGSFSCSFICSVAISTVLMRFVRSFTSDGNAVC